MICLFFNKNYLPRYLVAVVFVTTLFVTSLCMVYGYTPEMILLKREQVTPNIESPDSMITEPLFFPKSNNLRRKASSPFVAFGSPLEIEGFVTDLNDVPLEDTVIKIWQANHNGFYNHLTDIDDHEEHDIDFAGAGICSTNNAGYYSFKTIVPGKISPNRAPHIHMKIENKYFGTIRTQIFFQADLKDPVYRKLSIKQSALIIPELSEVPDSNSIHATFNITYDGIHPLKKY